MPGASSDQGSDPERTAPASTASQSAEAEKAAPEGAAPQSAGPHGPSPQSAGPPNAAPNSAASPPPESADGEVPAWKKYLASAILLALGLVLLASAWLAYPTPETGIPIPASPSVSITINRPIYLINYSVVQAVRSALVDLRITVTVFSGGQPPGPEPLFPPMVEVALPPGVMFQDFHLPPNGYMPAESKPLDFGSGTTSTVVFPLDTGSFGSDSNGVNAYAAIPDVSYQQTGARAFAPPIFFATYRIPSPTSYDWSQFPPEAYGTSLITWKELLTETSGDTAGRVVLGLDRARQSSDTTWTFVAGALLGLGGGAILAAVQEFLHIVLTPERARPEQAPTAT
jgi:hypothetical protein